MNKEALLKMLKAKEDKRAASVTKSTTSESVEELRSINKEVEELNIDIAELRSMIKAIEDEEEKRKKDDKEFIPEKRNATIPVGPLTKIGTFGMGVVTPEARQVEIDPFGTPEYRTAFMKFARTGEMGAELRANEMTTTSEVAAIIPSTILNEVIKKMTSYGQIYARIRKLAIKGGVSVPILSLKPNATWIGQSATSDKKKITVNTNVTFSYYGLECKISTSLLADTVTLTGFESVVTDLIVEAMIKAVDTSVISGTGSGQPLGITQDTRVPAAQIVTLTSAEFLEWATWKKKVFAKMPLSYKAGATFLMASGTFEGYIDGMVDTQGQPVGRVNYGIAAAAQESFGGKAVIQVEDDIIATYDDAATGDVVAIYCNLNNYAFNSNLQMTMYRYLDHDTNEYIDKAIMIADGKLLDPNGVVIIRKGI